MCTGLEPLLAAMAASAAPAAAGTAATVGAGLTAAELAAATAAASGSGIAGLTAAEMAAVGGLGSLGGAGAGAGASAIGGGLLGDALSGASGMTELAGLTEAGLSTAPSIGTTSPYAIFMADHGAKLSRLGKAAQTAQLAGGLLGGDEKPPAPASPSLLGQVQPPPTINPTPAEFYQTDEQRRKKLAAMMKAKQMGLA